jgi:FkbM family methyltransferase
MADDVVIRAEGLGKKYPRGWDLAHLRRKLYDNRLTRPVRGSIVRWMVSKRILRRILNKYYHMLSYEAKSLFHARYSKIFRSCGTLVPGEWMIEFLGHPVRLPLRSSLCWLDWDCALSVLGHDAEIKQTYEALIESDQRPSLFVDVGANYGTHSILFLAVGIPIIAFEPNPECYPQFQTVCGLNHLNGRWEQSALGKETGQIDLIYPEKETWLGSTCGNVVSRLRSGSIVVKRVPIRMLDDYLDEMPDGEILLKLDVEGSEIEVLKGASRLLRSRVTKIVFESNDIETRLGLFDLLAGFGYGIYPLPWRQLEENRTLRRDEFLRYDATNFMANRCAY